MKSFIKLLLLLLLPSFGRTQQLTLYVRAQQNQIDSLQQVLQHSANDTLRMEIYRDLGLYYQEIKRDSALYCHEQQLLLAQKLKFKLWEADAYDLAGYLLNSLGNYPRSLQYFLKGIKIAGDPQIEKGIWKLSIFTKEGTTRTARLSLLGNLHQDLGYLYDQTGNFEQAIIQLSESNKIAASINNKVLLSFVDMTLGITYQKLNRLDSAIIYQQKALDYCRQSGFTRYSGVCLLEIGTAYLKKGDKALARKYFTESAQSNLKENSFKFLADAYLALANLFRDEGAIDSSLWYAKKSLEIYQATGSPPGIADAYTSLSSIYKLRNKTDSAYLFQSLAMTTKDSIYNADKIKQFQNIGFDEQLRIQQSEKEKIQLQDKIRTYALLAGSGVFIIIAFILYRNNRQKQKANKVLEKTLTNLTATQSQLIQSEKMASLGELTAGIAHEIQNPLNFVNNFSEVNTELIEEIKTELKAGNNDEAISIANDIADNEQKINHHGKRADAIVKGMLQHSRSSSGIKEPTDINALADEYLRLAYHGLRAKDKSLNATMKTDFDETIGNINIIPQDIGRVILNLITNAFYAVIEKKNASTSLPAGQAGSAGQPYEPTVSVSTKKINARPDDPVGRGKVEIRVGDNGNGIPQKILDKIFQPFFTTKPTGQGTGLGLSLSYDIIKAHGGEIKVETKEGEGTEFIIQLPLKDNI